MANEAPTDAALVEGVESDVVTATERAWRLASLMKGKNRHGRLKFQWLTPELVPANDEQLREVTALRIE